MAERAGLWVLPGQSSVWKDVCGLAANMAGRTEAEGQRDFMSVNLIFKIAAVGILVTVLSQVLKHSGREEHAFLTSLAGLIIVLFWIVPYIYELFETMKDLFSL